MADRSWSGRKRMLFELLKGVAVTSGGSSGAAAAAGSRGVEGTTATALPLELLRLIVSYTSEALALAVHYEDGSVELRDLLLDPAHAPALTQCRRALDDAPTPWPALKHTRHNNRRLPRDATAAASAGTAAAPAVQSSQVDPRVTSTAYAALRTPHQRAALARVLSATAVAADGKQLQPLPPPSSLPVAAYRRLVGLAGIRPSQAIAATPALTALTLMRAADSARDVLWRAAARTAAADIAAAGHAAAVTYVADADAPAATAAAAAAAGHASSIAAAAAAVASTIAGPAIVAGVLAAAAAPSNKTTATTATATLAAKEPAEEAEEEFSVDEAREVLSREHYWLTCGEVVHGHGRPPKPKVKPTPKATAKLTVKPEDSAAAGDVSAGAAATEPTADAENADDVKAQRARRKSGPRGFDAAVEAARPWPQRLYRTRAHHARFRHGSSHRMWLAELYASVLLSKPPHSMQAGYGAEQVVYRALRDDYARRQRAYRARLFDDMQRRNLAMCDAVMPLLARVPNNASGLRHVLRATSCQSTRPTSFPGMTFVPPARDALTEWDAVPRLFLAESSALIDINCWSVLGSGAALRPWTNGGLRVTGPPSDDQPAGRTEHDPLTRDAATKLGGTLTALWRMARNAAPALGRQPGGAYVRSEQEQASWARRQLRKWVPRGGDSDSSTVDTGTGSGGGVAAAAAARPRMPYEMRHCVAMSTGGGGRQLWAQLHVQPARQYRYSSLAVASTTSAPRDDVQLCVRSTAVLMRAPFTADSAPDAFAPNKAQVMHGLLPQLAARAPDTIPVFVRAAFDKCWSHAIDAQPFPVLCRAHIHAAAASAATDASDSSSSSSSKSENAAASAAPAPTPAASSDGSNPALSLRADEFDVTRRHEVKVMILPPTARMLLPRLVADGDDGAPSVAAAAACTLAPPPGVVTSQVAFVVWESGVFLFHVIADTSNPSSAHSQSKSSDTQPLRMHFAGRYAVPQPDPQRLPYVARWPHACLALPATGCTIDHNTGAALLDRTSSYARASTTYALFVRLAQGLYENGHAGDGMRVVPFAVDGPPRDDLTGTDSAVRPAAAAVHDDDAAATRHRGDVLLFAPLPRGPADRQQPLEPSHATAMDVLPPPSPIAPRPSPPPPAASSAAVPTAPRRLALRDAYFVWGDVYGRVNFAAPTAPNPHRCAATGAKDNHNGAAVDAVRRHGRLTRVAPPAMPRALQWPVSLDPTQPVRTRGPGLVTALCVVPSDSSHSGDASARGGSGPYVVAAWYDRTVRVLDVARERFVAVFRARHRVAALCLVWD